MYKKNINISVHTQFAKIDHITRNKSLICGKNLAMSLFLINLKSYYLNFTLHLNEVSEHFGDVYYLYELL